MRLRARNKKILLGAGGIYPGLLLFLSLVHWFFPQRSGVLAFTQVFAPFLWGPLLFLTPLLFFKGAVRFRLLMLACGLVWCVRFFPALNLFTSDLDAGAFQFDIITWNVYINNPQLDKVRDYLHTHPAQIVAMQETNGDFLANDPLITKVYPYRLIIGHSPIRGLVILSSFPITASNYPNGQYIESNELKLLWARLDLGQGRAMTVATVHPYRPNAWGEGCSRPFCFEPSMRDQQLTQLRSQLNPLLQTGEPLMLVGDFNTTEREPAYQDFSQGLQDAQKKAGTGWGGTWGKVWKLGDKLALLRIDYLFSTSNVTPLHTAVDCTDRGSDHCLVYGRFEVK